MQGEGQKSQIFYWILFDDREAVEIHIDGLWLLGYKSHSARDKINYEGL